jgi:hypothetical protein
MFLISLGFLLLFGLKRKRGFEFLAVARICPHTLDAQKKLNHLRALTKFIEEFEQPKVEDTTIEYKIVFVITNWNLANAIPTIAATVQR